jgi:hypothetical protein
MVPQKSAEGAKTNTAQRQLKGRRIFYRKEQRKQGFGLAISAEGIVRLPSVGIFWR